MIYEYVCAWLSILKKEIRSYYVPGTALSSFPTRGSHGACFTLILQVYKEIEAQKI